MAAARAASILSKDELEVGGIVAVVDPAKLGRDHVAFVEVRLTDTTEAALRAGRPVLVEVQALVGPSPLGVPRRTVYYEPRVRRSTVDTEKAARIDAVIERFPTYGYRRVAVVLGWNRKVVQRVFQRRGWQVRKRAKGFLSPLVVERYSILKLKNKFILKKHLLSKNSIQEKYCIHKMWSS